MTSLTQAEYKKISDYIMPAFSDAPCDIALLFGTRHGINEFIDDTLALWRQGRFKEIIVSGGITDAGNQAEANLIIDKLLEKGMPSEIIIAETKATNTGENVIFSRQLLASRATQPRSILCIGKLSSLRRYAMTVKRHWPDIYINAHGVNYFGVSKEDWLNSEEFKSRVLLEHQKIPEYIKAGYITEID